MPETHASSVVQLLDDIRQRGQDHKDSLPQRDVRGEAFWSGIGFRLNGVNYIVPIDEIVELIPVPHTTKVPGTKNWHKGVANLRGVLLSLVDLQEYLGRSSSRSILKQRVLVIDQEGSYLGLVVDEIRGLHHFDEDEQVEADLTADAVLAPYIIGAFERDGELWRIFGIKELFESPEFHQVAV
ncbi:chemotaxis protein CheW [Kangiella japonica]|uniref:Chemotaxis protein CheW n=1 Tax=Kangiella japonica TaxID=647384 RepID=A0ABN0T1S0_9GAMM